jgi:hypothetical protein
LTNIIVTSPEFLNSRGGGTLDGILAALYGDALGRPIDAGTDAAYHQVVAQYGTAGRDAIIQGVINSAEYQSRVGAQFFQHFIGRAPDAPSLSAIVNAQMAGFSNELLAAILISSDEFFHHANI